MEPTPEEQYQTQAPVFELEKNEFLIEGTNAANGERLFIDGVEILPDASQKIRNHSPDGFSWGYRGSGPAQTALSICLHILKNRYVAEALYQDFKEEFVASWQPSGTPFRQKIDMANFLIDHGDRLNTALQWQQWEDESKQFVDTDQDDEDYKPTSIGQILESQMVETLKQIRAEEREAEQFWSENRYWSVGDLVTVRHPDNLGVKALVYEVYERGEGYAISLITQDGRNLGGWERESWRFLEFEHNTGLYYRFKDVFQLHTDFINGLFTPYFEIL